MLHILVYVLLKIDVRSTQRTNHDIGADAGVDGDIAHRIIQRTITGVVAGGDTNLLVSIADDALRAGERCLRLDCRLFSGLLYRRLMRVGFAGGFWRRRCLWVAGT